MRFYPINLDLKGRRVTVVGGGSVAARKVQRLVAAGARVTVVAPDRHPALELLAARGQIAVTDRPYREGDLQGAFLVFAATADRGVNRSVAQEARREGILVDQVDDPDASDFSTPALLERGELLIAVSTGGASPALAREIVRQLEEQFGAEYATALALLGRVREKILTEKVGDAYNSGVFAQLALHDLPALIRNGEKEKIDQILLKLVGPGFTADADQAEKKDPS